MREPILFCFCGPGASGKSTICRELLKEQGLVLSISTTTRAPRGAERDGVEYFFVDEAEFQARIAAKRFIEHAVFNNKRYGTETTNIERARASNADLLLDIDVQGAEQLKKLHPGSVVTVCVFPPSFSVLRERFGARGTDDAKKVEERLAIARDEIRTLRAPGFSDYLVINDSLEAAVSGARSIVDAERLRFSRLPTELVEKTFGS